MKYKNFRSSSVFDFSHTLDATVSATKGVWTSLGQVMHAKWEGNSTDGQLIPYERYPQVIMVNFKASGTLLCVSFHMYPTLNVTIHRFVQAKLELRTLLQR